MRETKSLWWRPELTRLGFKNFEQPHIINAPCANEEPLSAYILMTMTYSYCAMFLSYLPYTCSPHVRASSRSVQKSYPITLLQDRLDCLPLILFHSFPICVNPSIWRRDVRGDLCQLWGHASSILTLCELVCVQTWIRQWPLLLSFNIFQGLGDLVSV